VSTARAERLVNLVLCLLSTRQYLTAERIRGTVPGYADAPSDEAFFRMFERDKSELRELDIPLETGRNSAFDHIEGYRIARRDYELGDIDLEPDEATAVALAVRLWDSPRLTGAANGAVLKLRAAGVDLDPTEPVLVEPRVRAGEPGFDALLGAVQDRRVVTFRYRRSGGSEVSTRVLEPWGVVLCRGRWYVIGLDRGRQAPRCFRLSRISGEVTTTGRQGAFERPPGVDLMEYVGGRQDRHVHESAPARMWVADGRAHGLRRRAKVMHRQDHDGVDGDLMEIDLHYPESAVSWLAGFGPDVVVWEPPALVDMVAARLRGVLEATA
jgi:proteasome accessory factor B